jgi:hypothetical protein
MAVFVPHADINTLAVVYVNRSLKKSLLFWVTYSSELPRHDDQVNLRSEQPVLLP